MTLSKTLRNGIPLSAVITNEAIERRTFERGIYFYTTHAKVQLPAAVGLKVIDLIMLDGLTE